MSRRVVRTLLDRINDLETELAYVTRDRAALIARNYWGVDHGRDIEVHERSH